MFNPQPYLDRIRTIVGKPVTLQRMVQNSLSPVTMNNGYWYVSTTYGQDSIFYVRTNEGEDVAQFALVAFPGCCGLVIGTGALTQAHYQRRGIGQILLEMKQDICKNTGYTVLVCTDVDKNTPEKHILEKFGFKCIFQFVNRRTNNLVNLSVKHLTQG